MWSFFLKYNINCIFIIKILKLVFIAISFEVKPIPKNYSKNIDFVGRR